MTFIKEWYDEAENTWVMQFGVYEEELATIQKIEAEQGRSFSEIISDWLAWVIKNPKEGMDQVIRCEEPEEKTSNLQLPTISVKELQDHIEDDNFFRVYGNPVVVKCDGHPDCVVMSIEHMERIRKTIDEAEKAINAMAVMMCPEDYRKYWEEKEHSVDRTE